MSFLKIFIPNLLLTVLVCASIGPAASKLQHFGLVSWAARAPFYLLQLYIAPVILYANSRGAWYLHGPLIGLMCTVPLALWSICTHCPPFVPITYLVSGFGQGSVIAWLAGRSHFVSRAE